MSNAFRELLEERRMDYKTWVPVYCPALRNYIFFNMLGFNHLRFKIDGSPRNPKEAMYKLGLLPLVRPAIHSAAKIEKNERRLSPVGGSRKKVFKEIEYWSVIEVVGRKEVKIRVVFRRIGTGNVHFWSVMKLAENQKTP